jgi:hypothetical protein
LVIAGLQRVRSLPVKFIIPLASLQEIGYNKISFIFAGGVTFRFHNGKQSRQYDIGPALLAQAQ